jgi:hypothetical protein
VGGESGNKAFVGAYNRGYRDGVKGKSERDCPYPDYRCGKHGHVITFSRAFRRYWRDGLEAGRAERRRRIEEESAL